MFLAKGGIFPVVQGIVAIIQRRAFDIAEEHHLVNQILIFQRGIQASVEDRCSNRWGDDTGSNWNRSTISSAVESADSHQLQRRNGEKWESPFRLCWIEHPEVIQGAELIIRSTG